MIHPSSIVHKKAKIGANTTIGPFCQIGKDVVIGKNCILKSHVVIEGNVIIGDDNVFFPFSTIGTIPQDLKYKGEKTKVIIGNNCKMREYCTINLGTKGGGGTTRIGDNCLLMIGTHIAHDCIIDKNVIFANHSTLAGHVEIEKNVVVGALSAIHQFSRIGEGAMIGGMSGITADVPPFCTALGNRAKLNGLNIIGLKRNLFDKEEIYELRKVYQFIFGEKKLTFKERVKKIRNSNTKYYTVNKLADFILEETQRSFCMP